MRKRYYRHWKNKNKYLKIICVIKPIKKKKFYLVESTVPCSDLKDRKPPKCKEYKCPVYKKCSYNNYRICYSEDYIKQFYKPVSKIEYLLKAKKNVVMK